MRKKVLLVSLLMSLSLASCVAAPVPNVDSSQTSSTPGESTPTDPTTPAPNPDDIGPNQPTPNNILHTDLSTDSTLSLVAGAANGTTTVLARSSVDYNSRYQKVIFTDANGYQRHSFIQNTNGKVANVYLDARNYTEVQVTPTDANWADLGWISSIGISEFRNADGGSVYTYGGGSHEAVLKSLTRIDDLSVLFASGNPTITLTVSGDLISSVKAVAAPDANGNRYELDITIQSVARNITLPVLDQNSSDASVAMPNFVDDNKASYRVITQNTLNPNVTSRTTFNKEIVYTEVETKVGNNSTWRYYGYFNTPVYGWTGFDTFDGQIDFTTLPNRNISSFEKVGIEGGLNFGMASYFFKWEDGVAKNKLVPTSYLQNASDFIPYKLSDKSAIREYTIAMGVGTDGRISNISYDIVGSDGTVGKETMLITYAGGVDANSRFNPPTTTLNLIRNASSNEQFTWRSESDITSGSTVWQELASAFTDAVAADIPYRYVESLSGKWTVTKDSSTNILTLTAPNPDSSVGYSPNTWVNEYRDLLLANGYSRSRAEGDTTYYTRANFNVEIGIKSSTFTLYLANTIR